MTDKRIQPNMAQPKKPSAMKPKQNVKIPHFIHQQASTIAHYTAKQLASVPRLQPNCSANEDEKTSMGNYMLHADDNLLRNVINEVLRECQNHQFLVVPDCVKFFTHLLALDPNQGLADDVLNTRDHIHNFVNLILHWMHNQSHPKLITVKLQHRFAKGYEKIEHEVKRYRSQLESKLYPLIMSIVEPDQELPVEELYKKLAYYTTLVSGTGNPKEKQVYKESLQVLKSIFEMKEIQVFPKLLNFVRRDIVENLVELTTGVKLYNKACNKGGEGVPNLPKLLENGISSMIARTNKVRDMIEARARALTSIFENNAIVSKIRDDIVIEFSKQKPAVNKSHSSLRITITNRRDSRRSQNIPSSHKSPEKTAQKQSDINWEYLSNLMIVYRQASANLRLVGVYLRDMEADRKSVCDSMEEIVKHLHYVIIPNLHQAASLTFPHFQKLSEIWRHLQNEAVRLDELDNIVERQADLVHQLQYDINMIKTLEAVDNRYLSIKDEKMDIYQTDVEIMDYDESMTLEFRGFCCWFMVHTDGVLIPGKPERGVLRYQNKYYTFSYNLAANCFAKNPEEYLGKALQICRREFHLINFLHVREKLEHVADVRNLYQPKHQIRHDMVDVDQQTEIHPIKSNFDIKYRWNLWDYKRQVLKMVDMVQMQTKGTATSGLKSQFKNNQATQTFVPTQKTTQTIKQEYVNTDKLLSYLMDLRGKRECKPRQVIWLKK